METTRQNGELAEAIQKKDLELEQQIESLAEQEHIIQQRDGIIKMLSEKEEEHTNIIKLLRNNLEMRTQADIDVCFHFYFVIFKTLTIKGIRLRLS